MKNLMGLDTLFYQKLVIELTMHWILEMKWHNNMDIMPIGLFEKTN